MRLADIRLDAYASVDNVARAAEVTQRLAAPPRVCRVDWSPGLSVVILTLDRYELIDPLLTALEAARERVTAARAGYEVIVGDTGSTDPRVLDRYTRCPPFVRIVRPMQYHFSRCNNALFFTHARFDRVLFLNNDIIFDDAAASLTALHAHLDRHERSGAVGAVLHLPDQTIQHAGIDVLRDGPWRRFPYHPHHGATLPVDAGAYRPCPAATGAFLAVRSSLFARLDGFDEGYATECQDVALCLAAGRLGYRVEVLQAGHIVHLENGTRPKGSEDWGDRQRFLRKWGAYIEATLL
jgi:GT2 family glycosyltransferase